MASSPWRPIAWPRILLVLACSQLLTAPAGAADLEQRTIDAYNRYVEQAKEAFLRRAYGEERTSMTSPSRPVTVRAIVRGEPSPSGRIVKVPSGLVHHWIGATFIDRATIADALAISRAYETYPAVYRPVISSRLLGREGCRVGVAARPSPYPAPSNREPPVHGFPGFRIFDFRLSSAHPSNG